MEETKNEKEEDILSLMQTWKRSTQGQKNNVLLSFAVVVVICRNGLLYIIILLVE